MTRLRFRKVQMARRLVQLLAVLVLLSIPAVSRYSNYLASRELDRTLDKWTGTLQGGTLAAIDAAIRTLPGAEKERAGQIVRDRTGALEYAQMLRGGPWSIELGPVSLTDPLAVVESATARKRMSRVLLVGAAIPIFVTLLFGRVFCSWICPMGLLLEGSDKLRKLMRFAELPPLNIRFSRSAKYILLVAGLIVAAVSSLPVLAYVYPPAIMSREGHDFVFALFDKAEEGAFGFSLSGLSWMSMLLGAIVLTEVTFSRRWWCRYLCPGGALYGLIGVLRPVRVKLNHRACTRCADCVTVCPAGLNPMQNQMGIDCDNCGLCVSHCDDKALRFGLGSRNGDAPVSARASLRWGGTRSSSSEDARERVPPKAARARNIALLLVLFGLWSGVAQAHHILGVPHYAYDEEYPQTPVLTYRVQFGSHEVKMTSYPGRPDPGEACSLHVYIRNLRDGRPFDSTATMTISRDELFGGDPVVYGPVEAQLEEAVYKFFPVFEEEANYVVRIAYEFDGAPWIIDLPMVVGQPGSPWKVLGGIGGGLALFLIVVRAIRIKMIRRARAAPHEDPEPEVERAAS